MNTNTLTTQEQQSSSVAVNNQTLSGTLDSILVSYDTRVNRKDSEVSLKPLSWVVAQIRTSTALQQSIAIIRAESDDEKRRSLKAKLLPYFTFLHFGNGIRKRAFFQSVKYILIDIDHVSDRVGELREQMREDPDVFLHFLSPSGDGLKVVFALDREITTEVEYKQVYQRLRALVKERYGVETDDTKDVARATFLSFDPDLYVNPSALPLSVDAISLQQVEQPKPKVGASMIQALVGASPGARTPNLTKIVGLFINKRFDRDFALEFIRAWNQGNKPPHRDQKLVDTVNSMYDEYEKSDKYRDIWSYETEVLQAGIVGEEFFLHRIGPRKAFALLGARTPEERARMFDEIVQQKHIPHLKRVNFLGDINTERSFYSVNVQEGMIDVHYAPIPVVLRDNDFIEGYLKSIFREQVEFIKQYLAVYTYTNYRKLPTLVLKGERSNGKNTFAEMVADIYKPLSQPWHGNEKEFNPEVERKLLISEETVTDDPVHYKMLKKLSGAATHVVNKKHQQQYEVANNLNLILLSNAWTPIFVEREELPESEIMNQFFVYEFRRFAGLPDPDMAQKLRDRLGHYIRTELKTVFESLSLEGKRYSINVPITEAERQLFRNSATDVEYEADTIIQKIVDKYELDQDGEYKEFVKDGYLPAEYLHWVGDKRMKKRAIKNLIERGYLVDGRPERPQYGNRRLYSHKMTYRLRELLTGEDLSDVTVKMIEEFEITVSGIVGF